ncbi:hypothetical protein, partial [Bradyrhizobium zhanjiangense]|uniref:hypothetical protein n=1 Tax=Bradyrhizobium zhanjiangense TaxID=1325107 RepID=UPI0019D6B32C
RAITSRLHSFEHSLLLHASTARALRLRSLAHEQITPSRGKNEKPDLYAAATCIKVRPYLKLAAIPNGCKGRFISFGRSRFLSRLRPEGGNRISSRYDYFFFFEVFFATFLVAAFAVFFAFFAFLAMSSSVRICSQ